MTQRWVYHQNSLFTRERPGFLISQQKTHISIQHPLSARGPETSASQKDDRLSSSRWLVHCVRVYLARFIPVSFPGFEETLTSFPLLFRWQHDFW